MRRLLVFTTAVIGGPGAERPRRRCRHLQRRRPPGGASCPWALSRGRRRRPGAAHDDGRSDEPAARQGNPGHGARRAQRPARRSARSAGRCSGSASSRSVPSAGMSRSLEFKLIPFGLSPKAVDGRFTAATAGGARPVPGEEAARRRWDRGQAHLPGARRPRRRIGRVHAARRSRRTSSRRARASTRSPSATTSARSSSRSRAASSSRP